MLTRPHLLLDIVVLTLAVTNENSRGGSSTSPLTEDYSGGRGRERSIEMRSELFFTQTISIPKVEADFSRDL